MRLLWLFKHFFAFFPIRNTFTKILNTLRLFYSKTLNTFLNCIISRSQLRNGFMNFVCYKNECRNCPAFLAFSRFQVLMTLLSYIEFVILFPNVQFNLAIILRNCSQVNMKVNRNVNLYKLPVQQYFFYPYSMWVIFLFNSGMFICDFLHKFLFLSYNDI